MFRGASWLRFAAEIANVMNIHVDGEDSIDEEERERSEQSLTTDTNLMNNEANKQIVSHNCLSNRNKNEQIFSSSSSSSSLFAQTSIQKQSVAEEFKEKENGKEKMVHNNNLTEEMNMLCQKDSNDNCSISKNNGKKEEANCDSDAQQIEFLSSSSSSFTSNVFSKTLPSVFYASPSFHADDLPFHRGCLKEALQQPTGRTVEKMSEVCRPLGTEAKTPYILLRENCSYCTDYACVSGILTLTSEFVTFEPDKKNSKVVKNGIGRFQVYVDMRDILECACISAPLELNSDEEENNGYVQILLRTLDGKNHCYYADQGSSNLSRVAVSLENSPNVSVTSSNILTVSSTHCSPASSASSTSFDSSESLYSFPLKKKKSFRNFFFK